MRIINSKAEEGRGGLYLQYFAALFLLFGMLIALSYAMFNLTR